MSSTFWEGIRSLRSVAYFEQAMNSGGTEDLKQKLKDNPRFRDRLMLSGVICASNVALFARSLYRKYAKNKKPNHKDNLNEYHSRDFTQKGVTLSKDSLSTENKPKHDSNQYNLNESNPKRINLIQDSFPEQGQIIVTKRSPEIIQDKNDIDCLFRLDSIPNYAMYHLNNNLIVMKQKSVSSKPNSIEIDSTNHKYFINESGIFDAEHNQLHNPKTMNEPLEIMKMIKDNKKNEIPDILSMFESFDQD